MGNSRGAGRGDGDFAYAADAHAAAAITDRHLAQLANDGGS